MGRSPCCDKTKVKRGPWSPEEDATLKDFLEKHGVAGNWIALPLKAGLKRCGKSCRLRWLNYLRPGIKHGPFSPEEDEIIFDMYNRLGSRWSVIASALEGRTDNDVKNHWNTKLKKQKLAANTTTATNLPKENKNADATVALSGIKTCPFDDFSAPLMGYDDPVLHQFSLSKKFQFTNTSIMGKQYVGQSYFSPLSQERAASSSISESSISTGYALGWTGNTIDFNDMSGGLADVPLFDDEHKISIDPTMSTVDFNSYDLWTQQAVLESLPTDAELSSTSTHIV